MLCVNVTSSEGESRRLYDNNCIGITERMPCSVPTVRGISRLWLTSFMVLVSPCSQIRIGLPSLTVTCWRAKTLSLVMTIMMGTSLQSWIPSPCSVQCACQLFHLQSSLKAGGKAATHDKQRLLLVIELLGDLKDLSVQLQHLADEVGQPLDDLRRVKPGWWKLVYTRFFNWISLPEIMVLNYSARPV